MAAAQRLPSESALSTQFGVSRATIREALRVLAAQNLIRTAKGATGGSFVTMPTVGHVSDSLSANINLLTQSRDVSLDEFLEAREYLEVPAAALAAHRRTLEDLDSLRQAIPDEPLQLRIEDQFSHNRDFHSTLVAASGNVLLTICAQPIFSVLQTNLKRSTLGPDFHGAINHDHRAILKALESGDADSAAQEMRRHLAYLRPMYEMVWQHGRRPRGTD